MPAKPHIKDVIAGSAKAQAVMAGLVLRLAKYHATQTEMIATRAEANKAVDEFGQMDKDLAMKGIVYKPGEEYTDPNDPRTAVEKFRREVAKPARIAYKAAHIAHEDAAADVRTQLVASMGGQGAEAFQSSFDPDGKGFRTRDFGRVEGKEQEAVKRTFDKARAFVGGVTGGAWEGAPVILGVSKTGRAFACESRPGFSTHCEATIGEVPAGAWAEDQHAQTAVHELGHVIEFTKPGVKEAANAFLAHRCGDEPIVPLAKAIPKAGYGKDEVGRKDHFDKAFGEHHAYYVGKQYAGGATEVISMGLEKLYTDPVSFLQADPEYCQFLFHVLSM